MNPLIRWFSISLLLLVGACDKNEVTADLLTMQVAEHYKDCYGAGPQKCLWVKLEDSPGWTFHYSGIKGFDYQEGFAYKLIVRRERIKNPPMDGSGIRYILVEVVEQIKI